VGLVLDAGAMLAFASGDREVAAAVEATRRRRERVATSAGCVAQALRSGGPRQALLARADSTDVIAAHVAVLAGRGDIVLTSHPENLRSLIRATRSATTIIQ
jgi:hypothetical protein